jgi:hypothetical protein
VAVICIFNCSIKSSIFHALKPNHVGEYFVIGMDIEQYDTNDPEKYLKGILHKEQEAWVGDAYRSYLAVFPSPTIGFSEFSTKVSEY